MFTIYKKGLGVAARVSVGVVLLLIALFAAYSLHGALINLPGLGFTIPLVGIPLSWGLIWSFVFFLFCLFIIAILVGFVETGVGKIDNTGRGVVVFLIETQGELKKVSWPLKNELIGSTIVVLICGFVLGVYVFGVDRLVTEVMRLLNIL